jgi:hypothetical protein
MAETIVEGTRGGVGARTGWMPRRATSAGHGGGGGAARGGGRITKCGRSCAGWRLGERHRQVTVVEEGTGGGAPRGGGGGATWGGGRITGCGRIRSGWRLGGSRRQREPAGRWSVAGWRRWSRVGRLPNCQMWEGPLGMFRVIIIG